MESALWAKPEDVRQQDEWQLKGLQEAYGEAMLEQLRARKNWSSCWKGRVVIEMIRQGLLEDGYRVSICKLCRWFGVPRRTVYYVR